MRSPTSGFMYQCNLHAKATFQAREMHDGSNQHQASCYTPHHVKMSLTIGATNSLVKRVALKGALAHRAHMVLNEGGKRVVEHDETWGRHIWWKRGSTKAGLDFTVTVEKTDKTQPYFLIRKYPSKHLFEFQLWSHFNWSVWTLSLWTSHLHMPLLPHGIDHTSFNGPPTGPTDGDAHLVMTGQTVELPL